MKRHSGNFYSHKCRLGVCPDLFFFIVLSCSLYTDAYKCRSNCPQARANHIQVPAEKKKKKGEKKTLSFSFKMKEICKPLRMWPQGEVREARGAKQRWWKGTKTMTWWRFRPREHYNILCCSFHAKCEMRVKSQQCFKVQVNQRLHRTGGVFSLQRARQDYTRPQDQINKNT